MLKILYLFLFYQGVYKVCSRLLHPQSSTRTGCLMAPIVSIKNLGSANFQEGVRKVILNGLKKSPRH